MIRIPYAERDGRLVHVSSVERGLGCGCVCPVCKDPVLARKGDVMRHHFAHYSRGGCSPETVLHRVGKELLYNRIASSLRRGRPIRLQWECLYCPDVHEGNLLKSSRRVEMEKPLNGCRPDLALLDGEGNPVAILEIVVTHRPDGNVLEYCSSYGVVPVCFYVQDGRDLLALETENPLRPSRVGLCLNPQCGECGKALSQAMLHVAEILCWRCGFAMKAAAVSSEGRVAGPEVFSNEQMRIAEESGVYISRGYSRRSNRRYMANTCPSCGAFTGAPYLHRYAAMIRSREGREAGSICMECAGNQGRDEAAERQGVSRIRNSERI